MRRELAITNGDSMVGDGVVQKRRVSTGKPGLFRNLVGSRRRIVSAMTVIAIASIALITLLPADQTAARPTREGGACDGCHGGAETPSMLTVTGMPSGTYVPGQQYTLTITITDTNGATGENAFDLLATAGSLTTTDSNAEINTPTTGYAAEASANDLVTPMKATSWTVVWTAPLSGNAAIDVWAVMGDGTTGTSDIWDHENYSSKAIPEFTSILIPIAAIVGVLVLAYRIKK